MRKTAQKKAYRPIEGNWLARDGEQWVVNIPTRTICGHKKFPHVDHGGVQGSYRAASKFQDEILKILEEEREFHRKHGEWPEGNKLHIRNRSGMRGVSKEVLPNRHEKPLIKYCAYWGPANKQTRVCFTTAHYSEDECKRLATLAREHKTTHPETILKLDSNKRKRKR